MAATGDDGFVMSSLAGAALSSLCAPRGGEAALQGTAEPGPAWLQYTTQAKPAWSVSVPNSHGSPDPQLPWPSTASTTD